MAFIKTTSPDEAEGAVRDMYARQQAAYGYVPNYAKVFSERPEIMPLWAALLSGIRRNVDPRRFELVTLAAAQALGSSYCSLAHGKVLTRFHTVEEVETIVTDPESAAISAAEAAMMGVARKVARNGSSVEAADIENLKRSGFTDAEIFDIVAVAAGRAFFANLIEALGAEADSVFLEMDPSLRTALTVGRPIDSEAPERLNEDAA
jgi:uncharacterized peroxidase-related enzyme